MFNGLPTMGVLPLVRAVLIENDKVLTLGAVYENEYVNPPSLEFKGLIEVVGEQVGVKSPIREEHWPFELYDVIVQDMVSETLAVVAERVPMHWTMEELDGIS